MGSRSINRTTQTRPCVAVKNWHVMSAELRAMSACPPMEPVIVYGAEGAAQLVQWENALENGETEKVRSSSRVWPGLGLAGETCDVGGTVLFAARWTRVVYVAQ